MQTSGLMAVRPSPSTYLAAKRPLTVTYTMPPVVKRIEVKRDA